MVSDGTHFVSMLLGNYMAVSFNLGPEGAVDLDFVKSVKSFEMN